MIRFEKFQENGTKIRVIHRRCASKYGDHSISSTVNLTSSVTTDEVGKIYFEAWKAGCKGVTIYREG